MRSRLTMLACAAVALATAACASTKDPTTPAGAQNYPAGPGPTAYVADVTGTVTRIDAPSNVVILDDGRMYQVVGNDVIYVNGQPVAITGLQPGTKVRLRSPKLVRYQNGQYVVVQNPSGTSTTVTTAPGSTAVVGGPYSGTVVRVDEPQRVIVFDDGRMWQTAGDNMVLVDGKPIVIGTVQPGTRVTVQQGYPVEYRDGRYVQITPGTTAGIAAGTRQTIYGKVTDVDRDGQITIKTDRGEFEMRVPVTAVPNIKKGDAVTLDVTITPADGSALPRRFR